mmetsp:Transcript_66470/g.118019  ORF Transcript_66470/g.118019 Transcript_66470/m.118019 type:complete len:672 (-) Transcript_66470:964-2979(-)
MQGVEKILLGELGKKKESDNTSSASEAQSPKTQDVSTSGATAPPAQPRTLPPPFESGCGDAEPVCKDKKGGLSEADISVSTDGEDVAVENEEVDVVNFEASLEQQLKHIVSDRSQEAETQPSAPGATGGKTTDDGAPDIDEWSGPDDLGYNRIPGRPGDEVYELVEDEEHRRHLLPYKEEPSIDSTAATQQQTVAVTGKQSTGGGTSKVECSVDNDVVPPAGSIEEAAPADPTDGPPAGTVGSNLAGEDGPAPQSVKNVLGAMDSISSSEPATPVSKSEDAATATTAEKPTSETTKPTVQPVSQSDQVQHTQDDSGRTHKAAPATVYEAFDLKVIYEVNRTGFEEHKDYPIRMHAIIAGRYQILEYLGSAAFSRAVQCVDLKNGQLVCVKIIRNNKDFFDQGLDEIKLLQYINSSGDADECSVLQLYDYFYHKEHLFLVCELLRDNLYEFSKYNRESGDEPYFTIPRLQRITRQILTGLKFIHRLNLIHCDLKPENILIKSYSRCEVKVIDFGSTCFTTDHLSSYVQSRCYRAPEVVLGLPYSQKIDLWSLGAILPELYNGRVLFHNDSIQTMMARIVAICGPIPTHMMRSGRYVNRFFTKRGLLYERNKQTGHLCYLKPKQCQLRHRIGSDDELFIDFVSSLLHLDPSKRPSAAEALRHPWLRHDYGPIQ